MRKPGPYPTLHLNIAGAARSDGSSPAAVVETLTKLCASFFDEGHVSAAGLVGPVPRYG